MRCVPTIHTWQRFTSLFSRSRPSAKLAPEELDKRGFVGTAPYYCTMMCKYPAEVITELSHRLVKTANGVLRAVECRSTNIA